MVFGVIQMFKSILVGTVALMAFSSANATDFSFTGTLPTPGTVQFFDFSVTSLSDVTFRSFGYAGGTNAAGTIISRGGFDPILSLFALPGGSIIDSNDDGDCGNVAEDAVSGSCWDVFLVSQLTAGDYRVSVSVYPNFPTGDNLLDGFDGADTFDDVSEVENNPRSNAWAFDILGVDGATAGNAVPEPASWAMLIAGFGLTGAAMRRRRRNLVLG